MTVTTEIVKSPGSMAEALESPQPIVLQPEAEISVFASSPLRPARAARSGIKESILLQIKDVRRQLNELYYSKLTKPDFGQNLARVSSLNRLAQTARPRTRRALEVFATLALLGLLAGCRNGVIINRPCTPAQLKEHNYYCDCEHYDPNACEPIYNGKLDVGVEFGDTIVVSAGSNLCLKLDPLSEQTHTVGAGKLDNYSIKRDWLVPPPESSYFYLPTGEYVEYVPKKAKKPLFPFLGKKDNDSAKKDGGLGTTLLLTAFGAIGGFTVFARRHVGRASTRRAIKAGTAQVINEQKPKKIIGPFSLGRVRNGNFPQRLMANLAGQKTVRRVFVNKPGVWKYTDKAGRVHTAIVSGDGGYVGWEPTYADREQAPGNPWTTSGRKTYGNIEVRKVTGFEAFFTRILHLCE